MFFISSCLVKFDLVQVWLFPDAIFNPKKVLFPDVIQIQLIIEVYSPKMLAAFIDGSCSLTRQNLCYKKIIFHFYVSYRSVCLSQIRVSIFNYQLFRHVEQPGWKLSWDWHGKEVIWQMWGAETTEQGDCSAIKGDTLPHCCLKEPVILDLLPGAPYNKQVANCCKGGVLTSLTQDPEKYVSSFEMIIASASNDGSGPRMPENFTLGIPGYTCGVAVKVPPTKFHEDQGRRQTQAVATWDVICSYSQFRASSSPACCVSLSAFYSETIVPCSVCSCGCQGQRGAAQCVKRGEVPPVLQLGHNELPTPILECTRHMCPIQVHWHVKQSYREYWRVKMTIRNLNLVRNYSQWNLVVLHPNLRSITQVFSFDYKPLDQYGDINDTGMFYGIKYYNDMLLQAGRSGVVQSELLLHKDAGIFTFNEGWMFPRKISFNGYECVLPSPDKYPMLPNISQFLAPPILIIIVFSFCLILTIF
ncbi:COBRA-like protein 6 isoform X1 [Solanum lycopersicum]|uniref:COBRA-like protein 6 isoform X1 n=1 Tax=Solanum lycopersicum TaxID=4081 RepID=UPI0008FEBB40|nr:COBRA-like protein 6 isoform X1 [Solanum lycopersicum]